MSRERTGQLIWRSTGWYARFWTVVDGEEIRVCRALGTKNKIVAKRKLERLLAAENGAAVNAKRIETFEEAAERVCAARKADGSSDAEYDLAALRRYAMSSIGSTAVTEIRHTDVNAILDECKAQDLAQQSVANMRNRISVVFAQLCREGVIAANPVEDSAMPKFQKKVSKERAVLTDNELATYLAWEHPDEHRRMAVLERQVMACVARMFGGLRTGDLHALRWDAFDVEGGGFEWGYAPRRKTKRPQLLEVPAMLRPIVRDWWERHGRPREGCLFPARRGARAGEQKLRGTSHAAAFRRDLRRANVAEPGSQRWRELFEATEYTLPVDFHSWRRAYAQALADADVSAQHAIALTGHSDMSVHARYLKSAGKMRRIPENALPQMLVNQKAPAKGIGAETPWPTVLDAEATAAQSVVIAHRATSIAMGRRPSEPNVGGSNPSGRAGNSS